MGSATASQDSQVTAQLRKVATAAIEGYNSWDIEKIMHHRHPTAVHEILPKSLNRPIMDNPTYRSYFAAIMPYFQNFHVEINDMVVDTTANKVAIWAKSTGSTEIGEYANEYMLFFYFDEEREAIVRSLEFVDSKSTSIYMGELGKWIKENKGTDGFEKRYGK